MIFIHTPFDDTAIVLVLELIASKNGSQTSDYEMPRVNEAIVAWCYVRLANAQHGSEFSRQSMRKQTYK